MTETVINKMLIGLSLSTALEVNIWSKLNISPIGSKTKHETLQILITLFPPLSLNLRKFHEKNKDSKLYHFVFLTHLYKLYESSRNSNLALYCDGKHFN